MRDPTSWNHEVFLDDTVPHRTLQVNIHPINPADSLPFAFSICSIALADVNYRLRQSRLTHVVQALKWPAMRRQGPCSSPLLSRAEEVRRELDRCYDASDGDRDHHG